MPKAFRSDAVLFTENGWGKLASGIRNREQILAEFETIRIFFKLADFSGLPVPEDNQRLRSILHGSTNLESIRELDHAGEGWPPRSLWSLLALGQHHGVPTRLLDWSRKPLTAAYFAAVDAARWLKDGALTGQRNATEIAIWALSARDLNKAAEKLHDDPLTEPAAFTPGFNFKSWVKSRPFNGMSVMALVGMTLVSAVEEVSMATVLAATSTVVAWAATESLA